jgi:hypothetical protein
MRQLQIGQLYVSAVYVGMMIECWLNASECPIINGTVYQWH